MLTSFIALLVVVGWVYCFALSIGWYVAGNLNIIKANLKLGLYSYKEVQKFCNPDFLIYSLTALFAPFCVVTSFVVYRWSLTDSAYRDKERETWVWSITPELFAKYRYGLPLTQS